MGHLQPTICESVPELARYAAKWLVEQVQTALSTGRKPAVLLSGGRTPQAMYRCLTEDFKSQASLLRQAVYFIGDEREVDFESDQSNSGNATHHFLNPMEIPAENRFLPRLTDSPNSPASWTPALAEQLTADLFRHVAVDEHSVPNFDAVLLGIGADGHIASLFPDTIALKDDVARYVINPVASMQTRRLTVTYPILNAGRATLILATGADKAPVLRGLNDEPPQGDYPVARLRRENCQWVIDASLHAATVDETRQP